ncbi:MAG: BREX-3 system P-loop-containing protein BrxF, partial [Candidatus Accumulibacter sp.]|nr:BREX-3 system P-loop-containing protein BrxF [Accumulibacter sp.]
MTSVTSPVAASFPALDKLGRLVGEIGDLHSKLILLLGNGGKTRLLRALAQQLNTVTFNVGARLGHRLAVTPVSERGFSTTELLREIT